jgi:hypothetical protein
MPSGDRHRLRLVALLQETRGDPVGQGRTRDGDGAVEQSKFYDYTVTRTDNLPDIHVGLIATDIDPTDVGQCLCL